MSMTFSWEWLCGFVPRDALLRGTPLQVTVPTVIRFMTRGEDLDRSSGWFGAGLAWKPATNISLALDYDVHLGDNYTGHQAMGMFKFEF